jgi:hypothetical protein
MGDVEIVISDYNPKPRLSNDPSYFLGCDPDLHTLSVAVLKDAAGLPVLDRILLVKQKGSKGDAAVLDMIAAMKGLYFLPSSLCGGDFVMAVESQDFSYTGRKNCALPSDLGNLAQVAGAVCMRFQVLAPRAMLLPKPHAWKKDVPKGIHQGRVLKRLGIAFHMMGGQEPYPVPVDLRSVVMGDKLNDGDWKDINDSIGLALYAWDWWKKGGE